MTAEIGLIALWLAASLAAMQLALAGFGVYRNDATLTAAVRPVAIVHGGLALLAMAALIRVFLTSDMSVALVVANSHSAKPWLDKFAGASGNYAGSMLLWVTILGLAGGAVAFRERRVAEATIAAALGAQAAISLGFYAVLLFALNPFARLANPPADGRGLDPLLHDPGLALHSPTLFSGYVGLSVAFSFALGARVTRDVGPAFARAMRPWVLGAWVFLTLGITSGSYRAYDALGWRGWWSWNPVENASLMPWLAATALLHAVSVLATRDALRTWTVMLAVVAFAMSMLGTFLAGSDIAASGHAFAGEPPRGAFILVLLALSIGGALALFAARSGTVRARKTVEPVSREGALVANNLLLSVILGIVLVGTLSPIVAAAMGMRVSVGPAFFENAAGPIALLLVAIMVAGPLLRWRRDEREAVLQRLTWPIAAAAFTAAALVALVGGMKLLPLVGLALAAGLAVASIAPLVGRNLRRTPLFVYGMAVAHLGIAVSLAGMAAASAFGTQRLVVAGIDEPIWVGPYRIDLRGIRPVIGDHWSALEARLEATRGDDPAVLLKPQSRFHADPPATTRRSAILTAFDGQLYTMLGPSDGRGRWQLALWWRPWVTLIWLGGAMMALGGVLSIAGHRLRDRRQTRRAIEAADAAAFREAWGSA